MTDASANTAADADVEAGAGQRGAPACPQCGADLYRRHCKYVCPNHGVVMDCGDTFWTG